MSNITDFKRNSMQTVLGSSVNNIDDLEIAYLQAAGATSNNVNDAWYQVFVLNGATSLNWNSAALQFLQALGYTGSNITDGWAWFWVTNGGVIGSAYATTGKRVDSTAGNYYSRAGNFMPANSGILTLCWFVRLPSGVNTTGYLMEIGNGRGSLTHSSWSNGAGNNTLACLWADTSGATNYNEVSDTYSTHTISNDQWFPVLFSYSNVVSAAHLYMNDISQSPSFVDYVNNLFLASGGTTYIGNRYFGSGGTTKFDVSHVWMARQYIDFSVESNRKKFYDNDLKPIDLGADGSGPTGTQPEHFFPDGNFGNNAGSESNWTVIGTVADSSTSPTD